MKSGINVEILVYADWEYLHGPQLLGILNAQRIRGKEIFSFEYNSTWLDNNPTSYLDPNLGLYKGKQFLPDDKINFGIFLDSSPDRWGRVLMRRKEALKSRIEKRDEEQLFESDYLLGVFDANRLGGLRFKVAEEGNFLSDEKSMATPPWTSLRELEYASLQLEKEDAIEDPNYSAWLNLLIAPGSSLGGARPKASVADTNQNLWIAKFPSSGDDKNIGAWEMVLNKLAKDCKINVPESKIHKYSGQHHTYLSKRFDRTYTHERIHFASAMTLLGYQDGTDYKDGVGYLDLAGFIMQHGAEPAEDLEQLWRRITFNILVSNTDDHLRNHGFLLTNKGWRLSPAFDLNPNEWGNGLTLNITDQSNDLDISLVINTAKYYKLSDHKANIIVKDIKKNISGWRAVAKSIGISHSEIERVKRAFQLADAQ
jgi:serine/threonine-protein kinase HipA